MTERSFWNLAATGSDRRTLVDADGTESTAGELHAACNQVVHGLRALGLTRGDVIATVLPNGAAFIEFSWLRNKRAGTCCRSTTICPPPTSPTSCETAARRR